MTVGVPPRAVAAVLVGAEPPAPPAAAAGGGDRGPDPSRPADPSRRARSGPRPERWDARAWLDAHGPAHLDPPAAVLAAAVAARDRLVAAGRWTGGPQDLGVLYEALLAPEAREAGAHYTPAAAARGLVAAALAGAALDPAEATVWDPACGGGAFLLAAADHLVARGADPARLVAGGALRGTDVDPGAVLVTAAALGRWAHEHGCGPMAPPPGALRVADSLLAPDAVDGPVDLVVGNPPFQGQLAGANVRDGDRTNRLRRRHGSLVSPYTDTAALFLATAVDALAAGGRCALVLPLSVLGARDAAAVRAHVAERTRLHGLWVAGDDVFDAAVEVCAPVLERRPLDPPAPTDDQADVAAGDAAEGEVAAERTVADPVAAAGGGSSSARVRAPFVTEPLRRWRGRSVEPLDRPTAGSAGAAHHPDARDRSDRDPVVERPGTTAAAVEAGPGVGGRRSITVLADDGTSWAPHALPILGVPDARIRRRGVLGDLVRATAGFRDEYYGLVPHVVEAPAVDAEVDGDPSGGVAGAEPDLDGLPPHLAPLVTVGLIDPGRCAWGRRPVTFAKRRLDRPVVDLAALGAAGGRAAAWATAGLVPKVVVATQTRVGEAAVDRSGRWVVSTPAIVLVPHEPAAAGVLDLVAAVVCSPVGSAAAVARSAGTGRSATAVRHTTASLARLPLPVEPGAWATGARALAAGDRPRFVAAMADAYDVAPADRPELAAWWCAAAP